MKRNAEYRTGRTAARACVAALTLATAWPAHASDHAEDRRKALVDDAAVTVHFRTYYFDRDKPDGSRSSAWAGGGWLGYESGWLRGFLQLGAVAYTSQPFWAPDDKDGTLLLKPGQDGYAVLGQAYAAFKFQDQVFTAYRQYVVQPEVNAQDKRRRKGVPLLVGNIGPDTFGQRPQEFCSAHRRDAKIAGAWLQHRPSSRPERPPGRPRPSSANLPAPAGILLSRGPTVS